MMQSLLKRNVEHRSMFSADLQALSIFRIMFGLVILTDFIFGFLPTRQDFFSQNGFLPHELEEHLNNIPGRYSLLHWFPQDWFLDIFTWVYGITICLFIVGYQTKIVKFVLFILQTSQYYRAITTMMGADSLMHLFLMWSLFLPLNRFWSIDSALRRGPREIDVPPICMLGIKMQIAMLYLFSGTFKLFGHDWWSGDAVGLALRDTNNGSELGHWLTNSFPWISHMVSMPVMFFQLSFSLLVYSPVYNNLTRAIALIGAVLLHTSFIFLLLVGLFPEVCLAYLFLLVPDDWWNALLAKRRARLERITLYFDPPCAFCEKIARLLRELCLSPYTPVVSADQNGDIYTILQERKSWVVVDGLTGRTYLKWSAVAFVLRQSPLTYLFGVITDIGFFKKIFEGLYDLIGSNRKALGAVTAAMLPYETKPSRPAPSWAQAICGVYIVVLVAINIASVPAIQYRYDLPYIEYVSRMMEVYQKWDLFAPSIAQWKYEYHFTGKTRDGEEVSLWHLIDPEKMERSADGTIVYHNEHWHKYIMRMIEPNKKSLADYFLRRICEIYNMDAIKNNEALLESVSFHIILRPLPGEKARISKRYGNYRYRDFSCITFEGEG